MIPRILIASLLLLCLTTTAHAGNDRGIQIWPDGTQIAATKDVGNERWSINLDPDRTSLSGTVYRPGEAPAFVWCFVTDITGDLLAGDSMQADCYGADRCDSIPCGVNGNDWAVLTTVSIPGSFFMP